MLITILKELFGENPFTWKLAGHGAGNRGFLGGEKSVKKCFFGCFFFCLNKYEKCYFEIFFDFTFCYVRVKVRVSVRISERLLISSKLRSV